MISKPGQRLDILAGKLYGDSSLWWVIAAASGIGWGLQIPGGTVLTVPTDISQIAMLVE
jgi:nucleoid-associated protein YgaU